jgi:hypothetical protein
MNYRKTISKHSAESAEYDITQDIRLKGINSFEPFPAGREGFEPSVDRSPQRFSRPSHSTTLAPSQYFNCGRYYILNFHARMQFRIKHFVYILFFQLFCKSHGRLLFTMHQEHFFHRLFYSGCIIHKQVLPGMSG